jgi:toxin-antitoxin system PIN domain toxin
LPDLNVWLALTWGSHQHAKVASEWFDTLDKTEIHFCRFTQIGLLRLLTTRGVMGEDCFTVREAWALYDRWLADPRIDFRREAIEVDSLFRRATEPFAKLASPKILADCYLLAFAEAAGATLVTLDRGMLGLGRRLEVDVVVLSED